MRTITLEEHFVSPAFLAGPGKGIKEQAKNSEHPMARIFEQLSDLGGQRIAAMDAAGIDLQVLSLNSPGVEQLEPAEAFAVARETNDFLAEAVNRHPSRFAGFATLPTAAPDKAAEELERTVRRYGFRGAAINGHVRGRYIDDKFFWPILERAEALDVQIPPLVVKTKSNSKQDAALQAVKEALVLVRSAPALEGTAKETVEVLLEVAAENLREM